ncbi:MAG TPA: esterase, partial [Actinopolymorphaceae bacterium]|nr:esterase [Actinopolymorphaceae bacterium]
MLSSRRSFLAASAGCLAIGTTGIGLVETHVLPGRVTLHSALGLTGPDGVIPSAKPGKRVTKQFRSQARGGRKVRWSVAYPPGTPLDARLPVILTLHGRGEDHRFVFDD